MHTDDEILREYLSLKDEVEQQRTLIAELTRPRHWTQSGPRGAQATAIHEALDRALEQAVKVRSVVRPNRVYQFEGVGQGHRPAAADAADGFYARLRQAADLLGLREVGAGSALAEFVTAVTASSRPVGQIAWLAAAAALGRYPQENELENAMRELRRGGAAGLGAHVRDVHDEALDAGQVSARSLSVRERAVIVDVTHTARHDLHTGIQRVVREVVSRWLADPATVLVWWDDQAGTLRELGRVETFRFRNWLDHLPTEANTEPIIRDFSATPSQIVVPWDGTFVVPELAPDHARSSSYCALARSSVLTRLGVIGFDLVPVAAAETVHAGMVAVFNTHVSVVKHADRLSAISESAANEFRGLGMVLAAQGLSGPDVATHSLPPTPYEIDEETLAEVTGMIEEPTWPVVLVVGSREPRKNQIAMLEAAEQLWNDGLRMNIVMVGGSGWNATDINREIDGLRARGLPVLVRTRASEHELFAWYRVARFSVFPSLYEGFGLPIAESLGVGTPVITSNYGAMSEVAEPGGAILVDPRDPASIAEAMRTLLTDDAEVARLAAQAAARTWPTWDEYAAAVWQHLVR